MKPHKAFTETTNRGFTMSPSLPARRPSFSANRAYRTVGWALLATVLYLFSTQPVLAQSSNSQTVRNIVLVHGAWADGSSWSRVIPLLQAAGLQVTAVQLPLTSLADDTAAVNRAIALQDGPFLLVGHSYGGSVITEAGNAPQAAGLVYVAAFAPDQGQSTLDQITANPTPVGTELRPDAFGFIKLSDKGVVEDFAPDLPPAVQKILIATQHPIAGGALGTPISTPAWRNKPTWFVIASDDRMISPRLEESEARQMKAKSIVISSGHLVLLSHPAEVAGFIERAAHESGKE